MKNTQRLAPKIPDGMVELLKNLAKSILKEQPDDIYVFAAEYFENLVRQRDGGALDKNYGKFRKYSDLELAQLNGLDVCPRCHCTLHPPIRNALIEPPDYNAPSTSPKNTDLAITAAPAAAPDDNDDGVGDENALDMSVNGVAIKALPRDGKASMKNNQKNRPRLETIRSVSLDSAIDDDAKSPKSSEGSASEKKTDSAKLDDANVNANDNVNTKPTAVISTTTEKTVVKGAAAAAVAGGAVAAVATAAATAAESDKHDDGIEMEMTSKTPPNDVHIEQISSLKTDDDMDSSPNDTTTTTTSVSEANTDRTVIEVEAPLNIEPNELNKSEEIVTIVTKPSEDQQEEGNTTIADDVDNAQLNSVKQVDRLRTPESDSGLSEKSFNLALQENAETISNEVNEIKSETITTTTTKTMTTTTMSESTVEKIQVKSNENEEIIDEKQNQYEKELNMKNELLSSTSASSPPPPPPSSSSPPSPIETEKQNSITESTEILSQARKSIETIKTEKTEEITEMKKVEIKSASKQEIAKTVEKVDMKESVEVGDLSESQGEKQDEKSSSPSPPPTTSEKSISIEQKIEEPEISSTETSKTVEISSESKDDKREESMVKEQSEQIEVVTSHTHTKRDSSGSISSVDLKKDTEETVNLVEEQTDKASGDKTQIIEVDVEKNDLKTTDENKTEVVETHEKSIEVKGDEPTQKSEKDEPTSADDIVSSTEKQTIETTTKSTTQETAESTHHEHHEHQEMEAKFERIESVTETTAAAAPDEQHLQHTIISTTEEKSSMEQKSVESESSKHHSHSEEILTKVTTNELTEKIDEKQSDGIASEVDDLNSNVAKGTELNVDDEIDKTVIDINAKDESKKEEEKEAGESNKTTITTTDQIEKLTEQPADEKLRPESAADKDQTEKNDLTSEKLIEENQTTNEKLSEIQTIKTEEQHTIVEEKSDASTSKHTESTEQTTIIEEVKEAHATPTDKLAEDGKEQDDKEHQQSTAKIEEKEEEISSKQKSDDDELKTPPAAIEPTIVQTVETEEIKKIEKRSTEETKEQQHQMEEEKSTVQTKVVESIVVPFEAIEPEIKNETEQTLTQEKLSDKSIEKDDEENVNSWEKTTEEIAEYVQEHDGNQIKATAPLLTDITDDSDGDKINVVEQKEHIKTKKDDQIEQNEEITTTTSINSDVIEESVKKDIKHDGDDIDKTIVQKDVENASDSVVVVSESKEIVSSDLNVTVNEPNVMDDQKKEEEENATPATTITNRSSSSSSSSKIEGNLIQESKDTLKTVEIETKTTVLSAPQQITIDPIAAVIEKNVSETKEISPVDPQPSKTIETTTATTVDIIDNEKIGTNIDLEQTHTETTEINKSSISVEEKQGVEEENKKKEELTTTTTTSTVEQHEQNEPNKNVIEINESNLTQPESKSSTNTTEAVKETVESSNNLNGMNNNNNNDSVSDELSAMPTTSKVDIVQEVVDSKNDESSPSSPPPPTSSPPNEKIQTTTTITTTNENNLTKAFIENEQQNANVFVAASGAVAVATAAAAAVVDNFDTKSNNNDDVASESSAKDDYEQAVTRSVGDESEKELLNLSLNHDLESNQVNTDSVDSEQQQKITTVEIVTEPPVLPPQQQIEHEEYKVPIQPDSLDIVADSLDVSLEPSVEADSLNIDESSEEKTRSARSIETVSVDKKPDDQSHDDQIIKIDDTNELPLVRDVSIEIENKIDDLEPKVDDKTTIVMGDIVDTDTNSTDNMNDQMKNELDALKLDEKSVLPEAKEIILELEPKPTATMVIETTSNDKGDLIEETTKEEKEQTSSQMEDNKSEDAKEVTLEIATKPSATMVIETTSNEKDNAIEDKSTVEEQKNDNIESDKVSESNETAVIVKSDDSGNIEIHQESHESTEEMDRLSDTKDIDVTTESTIKHSIDIEKPEDSQNITDKVDTKSEESSAPAITPPVAAAVAAAAAAAGAVGTIITTESVTKSIKESQSTQHNEETKTMAMSETVIEHARTSSTAADDHADLKPNANDLPSSDFSDTETTTDKAEKMYTESGVDETSRDEYERDEVSEIENFDLSSCGEDSLEAMYYMIRKNEIIMDRHHKEGATTTTTKSTKEEEERITKSFPEKATDELEQAVREVSGNKKVKNTSIGSMNSSTDDVVLNKMSSDSDELQVHVMPNSEIESSVIEGGSGSESSASELKKRRSVHIDHEQSTVNESTDDEYVHNRNLRSMQKSSSEEFDEAAAVAAAATVAALSYQTSQSDSQSDGGGDHQHHHTETDTFDEHQMDDMMPGNIERKILASSVSDADSDNSDGGGTSRLTKDNFNVSTAFEHMIRNESITEESDTTIESSAATKIQAGARGFLTRRRNRRSDGSTGTSMSMEKGSSIGNAAIDKSMDNLIENKHEFHEETSSTVYSESFEESSERTHSHQMLYDQTIDSVDSEKVLGITEVKVEQRGDGRAGGDDDSDAIEVHKSVGGDGDKEKVPDINIQGISEESATASKRRQMLQRGDAMQRNSSAEQQSQQIQLQQQQQDDKEEKQAEIGAAAAAVAAAAATQNARANIKTDSTTKNSSKPIGKPLKRMLGVRQRSMPVQIDTQLIRILPKHMKKRVKSASLEKSAKPNVRRPSFF